MRRRLPALSDAGVGLSPLVLRRTFATRSLAEGRSIFAIAAQLGHAFISTTLGYVDFERRQHPVHVASALDRFGRVVLDRWKTPVLTSDLSEVERASILASAAPRDCGVGLCRCDQCVFIASDQTPPPCQGCEHLVTDPVFFPAWEHDLARRRRRIEELANDATLGTVAAAETAQLAEIERIYADLRARA